MAETNRRDALGIKDDSPYADVAEAMVEGYALANSELALGSVYHDLVEAVIHPYNSDAVKSLRDFVAQNRASRARIGRGPVDKTLAQAVLDGEAVLAFLGLEPSDYEREVKPVIRKGFEELLKSAEAFIGEHVAEQLRHAPDEVIYAGPGKLQN